MRRSSTTRVISGRSCERRCPVRAALFVDPGEIAKAFDGAVACCGHSTVWCRAMCARSP